MLNYLFRDKTTGFYIDCGACDPIWMGSNTYFFYLKGWKGINIDARPGSMKRFNAVRPLDINIEAAISDENGIYSFYEIKNMPESGSLSLDFLKKLERDKLIDGISQVKTKKLSDILDQYMPKNKGIDFLTMDLEGFELKALKSNNWNKYRPKVILVESFNRLKDKEYDSQIRHYLGENGYDVLAKTLNMLFFVEASVKLINNNQQIQED